MNTKKDKKMASKPRKIKIDSDAVRELAELFKENDLSEIEYEADGCRIRVARNQTVANYTVPHFTPSPHASSHALPSPEKEKPQDDQVGKIPVREVF